jgi:hypothetical protein
MHFPGVCKHVKARSYIRGEISDTLRKVRDTLKKYDSEVIADIGVVQHGNHHLQIAFYTTIEVS